MSTAAKRFPLEGLTVLNLAETYPGPFATMILADLGADVILVERPGKGYPTRNLPSFFAALNRNKRSIALDLKAPGDVQRLKELVTKADVLIETYRPGVMQRLGLGYDALAGENPRLIYLSISSYGQDGPYKTRPAHDHSCQGVAGVLFRQVTSDVAALPSDVHLSDVTAGLFAVIGVLSAIAARYESGRGTYVDLSMTDSMITCLTVYLTAVLNGLHPDPIKPAGHGNYRCADGRMITLSIVRENDQWQRLCDALGLTRLRELSPAQRVEQRVALDEAINQALATRARDAWAPALDAAQIAWGPLHSLEDVPQDAQVALRQMFGSIMTDGQLFRFVHQPIRFSQYATGVRRPSPKLGEHAGEVLGALRAGAN